MNTKKEKQRLLWVDILNICACFGVLVLHTTNKQVHNWNGIADIDFWWGMTTHTLVYWPVPVFLMLSGFNLFRRNTPPTYGWRLFYKKRIVKTLIPFCIWSLVYAIPVIVGGKITTGQFFEYLVQSKFNGYMWFFIPLFAFYLSYPVLVSWLKDASDKQYLIYMLIIFGFLYVIQPIYRFMGWEYFKYCIVPMGSSLLFYPLLGYAIYRLPMFNAHKRKVYAIGITAAVLHFVILSYSILGLGLKSSRYQNTEEFTSALMAMAVFLWFMSHNWESTIKKLHVSPLTISKIASCSLGIYLIQALLFSVSAKTGLFLHSPYFGAISTYFVALSIVLFMKKMPVLKYMVP